MKTKAKYSLLAITFTAWTFAMLSLGQHVDINLETSIHAADEAPLSIIDLDNDQLNGDKLGEFEPYYPELGNLMAKGVYSFYTPDEEFSIGIWESKAGEMKFDIMEYHEMMYVLDGDVTLTDTTGNSRSYSKGQGFIVPKGWSGTFTVGENGMRKLWVAYSATAETK